MEITTVQPTLRCLIPGEGGSFQTAFSRTLEQYQLRGLHGTFRGLIQFISQRNSSMMRLETLLSLIPPNQSGMTLTFYGLMWPVLIREMTRRKWLERLDGRPKYSGVLLE